MIESEIDEWLEKLEEEGGLRFVKQQDVKVAPGAIVVEILGYWGKVGPLIATEIQQMASKTQKLAGVFSEYTSEMIQLVSTSPPEIILPITILQLKIGKHPIILVTTNFAVPDAISYRLAEELYQFYQEINPSKILLVDGVFSHTRFISESPHIHKISSLNQQFQVINGGETDFTLMGQIASSLLTYWGQEDNIPIEMIVAESFADYDPISSHELLTTLATEWGVVSNFPTLEKDAREFKETQLRAALKEEYDNASDPRYFI